MADNTIPQSELLKRAVNFDKLAKEHLDRRTRERPDISRMHDVAKRTMDETAKRLGL